MCYVYFEKIIHISYMKREMRIYSELIITYFENNKPECRHNNKRNATP